jgi:uncharacterized FlaG/YvyC family protein
MLNYRDFYGGDFSDTQAIENAKTKKELAQVIERHRSHLEDMLSDANSHLDSFKREVKLTIMDGVY